MMKQSALDPDMFAALNQFAKRIRQRYAVKEILLYGSRARGDHRPDSDVDVAIVLDGARQRRIDLVEGMAIPAWEIMMETGVDISPFPMWQDEWDDPEIVFNPWLIRNIKAQGISL